MRNFISLGASEQAFPLDDRIVPASVFSSNGIVSTVAVNADGVRADQSFVPFPDFLAAHFTAASGDRVAVGSAEGGGPRVQLRQAGAVIADFFAYEDSFRSGVHVGLSKDLLATGAGDGGGPVVATFDPHDGREIGRFFAYDPSFRGGVRVAVLGDRIVTVPGPGGGPHVRVFDSHGVIVDEWLAGDVDRRGGFEPLLADFDHDGTVDVGIWDGHTLEFFPRVLRASSGPDAPTPVPFTAILQSSLAGFAQGLTPWIGSGAEWSEAGSISVGYMGRYISHDSIWVGLNNLVPRNPQDFAIGNPTPAPTTGRRPGNFDPADNRASETYRRFAETVSLSGETMALEAETLAGDRFIRPIPAGASIGSALGTGTAMGTFTDTNGQRFLVTARHVLYGNPYGGDPWALEQPGSADGGIGQVVSDPPYQSPAIIQPPATYAVDAVAVPIADSDPSLELFRGLGEIERPNVTGTIDSPDRGDLLIAIGRGGAVGIGYLIGRQQRPITVTWSSSLANNPIIADQWLAVGLGSGDLSYPGFSGGPVYRVTDDGLELLGMTVAGGGGISIITPIQTIEQSLGMSVITR